MALLEKTYQLSIERINFCKTVLEHYKTATDFKDQTEWEFFLLEWKEIKNHIDFLRRIGKGYEDEKPITTALIRKKANILVTKVNFLIARSLQIAREQDYTLWQLDMSLSTLGTAIQKTITQLNDCLLEILLFNT